MIPFLSSCSIISNNKNCIGKLQLRHKRSGYWLLYLLCLSPRMIIRIHHSLYRLHFIQLDCDDIPLTLLFAVILKEHRTTKPSRFSGIAAKLCRESFATI